MDGKISLNPIGPEGKIKCPNCGAGHEEMETFIPINVNCCVNEDGSPGEIILDNEEIYDRVQGAATSTSDRECVCNICGEHFKVLKGRVATAASPHANDAQHNKGNKMKEYDAHFEITGFYSISGGSKEEVAEKANGILNNVMDDIEGKLCTGVKDDNYGYSEK